jgi:hypothetical protein
MAKIRQMRTSADLVELIKVKWRRCTPLQAGGDARCRRRLIENHSLEELQRVEPKARNPARTASEFDAGYYRGLLEKAWMEVEFLFSIRFKK